MSAPNITAEDLFRSTTAALEQLTANLRSALQAIQLTATSVAALTDRVTMLERRVSELKAEGR